MTLGGVPVPRGTYTLWTLPSPSGWKFIVNKQTSQWGTSYNEGMDFARFDAVVKQLPSPAETLTVALEATGKTSGVLKLMWENTLVSAPFEKNTRIRPISPLDSSVITLNGNQIITKFSRPFMRGRTIWGVVVPWDSVWRTGANLSTSFATDLDLSVGDLKIPKGAYTLFSVPTERGLTLIVNKRPPGTTPQYDPSLDLVRIPMALQTNTIPVDPFRIWFEPQGARSAWLKIGWADHTYVVQLDSQR
jgi:hypothetical protein